MIRDGEAADFIDREITAVGAKERKPDGPLRHWRIV